MLTTHKLHVDKQNSRIDIRCSPFESKAKSVNQSHKLPVVRCRGKVVFTKRHFIKLEQGVVDDNIGIKIKNPVHILRQIFCRKDAVIHFFGKSICRRSIVKSVPLRLNHNKLTARS